MPRDLFSLSDLDDELDVTAEINAAYQDTIRTVMDDIQELRRLAKGKQKPEIKKQPEAPKIYRTEIPETNDPYWKNLEHKWKLK